MREPSTKTEMQAALDLVTCRGYRWVRADRPACFRVLSSMMTLVAHSRIALARTSRAASRANNVSKQCATSAHVSSNAAPMTAKSFGSKEAFRIASRAFMAPRRNGDHSDRTLSQRQYGYGGAQARLHYCCHFANASWRPSAS